VRALGKTETHATQTTDDTATRAGRERAVTADRVLTVAVALACLFAVGSGAASLDSAVDTSPGDAIDVDYASLPIESDDAGRLKEQYNAAADDGQPPESGSGAEGGPNEGPGDDPPPGAPNADSPDEDASFIGEDASLGPSEGDGDEGLGTGPGSEGPLGTLVSALGTLLSVLLSALGGLLLLGGLVLGIRHRGRIRARLWPYLYRLGFAVDDPTSATDRQVRRPEPDPQNRVSRAWFEMMERLGVQDEAALTPRELAVLAKHRGADPDVVWSLTEVFEEVTYGGAPVTDRRRERATRQLERFRHETGEEES
jgi:hypothetical protein